jgi:tetratricopeptide (TPR) repeat protein
MAVKRDVALAAAEKLLARGKYGHLLEENSNDILVLNKMGDICVLLNRPADSIGFFGKIADRYTKDGFFLKAIAIYKKINKLDPSKLEIYGALADLYHKQGLVPEARAQYQVLADHYLKQNQTGEAVAVYRKMAAVDPNDIKVPVRLADLLTAVGQTDQALMQYAVVGSMLVKRGALDEAVAVYQKALKIRPGDKKTLRDLVRSMLEHKDAEAAVLLLKAQPRDAETMSLLAESLAATGRREEARQAAEGAIAFDPAHEGARHFLARAAVERSDPAAAFDALRPIIEHAVRMGEVKKAIAELAPIAALAPGFAPVHEKLIELFRLGDDRAGAVESLLALARIAEAKKDSVSSAGYRRQILELDPENAEARALLRPVAPARATPTPAPAPAAPVPPSPPAAIRTPEPASPREPAPIPPAAESAGDLMLLDLDDSLLADSAPAPSSPLSDWGPRSVPMASPVSPIVPPPPDSPSLDDTAMRRKAADDAQWRDSITEAEVFVKYGLLEKAVEKYRAMLRRRKDDIDVRHRYVELLAEAKSPALLEEAATLAGEYRRLDRREEAETILERFLPAAPEPPAPVAPAPEDALEFDDFSTGPQPIAAPVPTSPPEPVPPPLASELAGELGFHDSVPATPSVSPVDLEYAFEKGLGRALDDEMSKFSTTLSEPPPPAPPVDEMSLFSDEQRFFNLAAELEKELEDEEEAPSSPVVQGSGEEVSLEEIFREFKRGVEQQLSPEDYETHYNLGIAYKEMGLLDEALGEFQIAAKDPARAVECCSMLGLCFVEKGLPQLAIQWFQKGLESPAITPEEKRGLSYDLASLHEQNGDAERAYRIYLEIYGENTNYRDVADRVKSLENALGR